MKKYINFLILTLAIGVASGCTKNLNAPVVSNGNGSTSTIDDVTILALTTSTDLDVLTWKTYRNEEYGFEFQYPEEWEYSVKSPGFIELGDRENIYYLEGSTVAPVTISIANIEVGFSIDKWVADFTKTKKDRGGRVKEIQICCRSRAIQSIDYISEETVIVKDDIMYEIAVVNLGDVSINQDVKNVYYGIVSSWEFIN